MTDLRISGVNIEIMLHVFGKERESEIERQRVREIPGADWALLEPQECWP